MADGNSQPADTMVERSETSGWKLWFLLTANRWLVTATLLAFVFLSTLAVSLFGPPPFRTLIVEPEPVQTLFQALTTALITGVTLVVTINQLVLSQELGAVSDQQERFSGALDFRTDAEATIDAPIAPPEPAAFLAAIVDASAECARSFGDAVEESATENGDLERVTEDFVDNITSHADTIEAKLEGAQFGTYAVMEPALDYNYSWKIFRARRIEARHGDTFTDEISDAHENVLDSLELFGLAREHFKTLYFQWELIDLSRAMMYVAVPALVVTSSMILFFDTAVTAGTLLGVDVRILVVVASMTVAVAPFVLLVAFVLRIATIARRTLAIGPFILRSSSRSEEIDWEE